MLLRLQLLLLPLAQLDEISGSHPSRKFLKPVRQRAQHAERRVVRRQNNLSTALGNNLLHNRFRHHFGCEDRLLEFRTRIGQDLDHGRANPKWMYNTTPSG